MINIKNVSYHIDNKKILESSTLDIPDQKLTALIGPNGAGKSTLLSLISRLNSLQEGEILINGLDIRQTKNHILAKNVAIFQQHLHLMNRLRVEELLMMARFPYHRGWPKKEDKSIAEQMIDRFSLQDIRHRFIDTLSGGQRQRALIAMVFMQDTPIILLDEPLNNLDIKHAQELMQCLRNAVDNDHKTIVVVLHDVNYASKYADHIIAMTDGSIKFAGATDQVLTEPHLTELFKMPVSLIEAQSQRLCLYY